MEYMAAELATHHFSLGSPYYPSGYFLCPLMISALGSFSSAVIILGDLSINADDSPNTLAPKSLDYLSPSDTSPVPPLVSWSYPRPGNHEYLHHV